MLDNNLDLPSDESKRHLIKIMGMVVLVAALFLMTFQFCGGPPTQAEIENRILESEKLRRVDNLCKELAKPPEFEFVYKVIAGNIDHTTIGYQFRSPLRYADVKKFYGDWATANNWVVAHSSVEADTNCCRFQKEDQTFEVSQSQAIAVDYTIDCIEANK